MTCTVINGDCLEVLQIYDNNTFDSIVTDPPYGLKFMGKEWDHGIPGIPFWQGALRVVKPGAHMLAFGGTRTHHRLMVAIEDAGWEIRDTLGWVYGSGFPKSLDVSKAIDKTAGIKREVVGKGVSGNPQSHKTHNMGNDIANGGYEFGGVFNITAPATNAAKQWTGWGTALKPAYEIVVMCRKPLEGTVAQNVLKWGVGGINIDGCRIAIPDNDKANYDFNNNGLSRMSRPEGEKLGQFDGGWKIDKTPRENTKGRFPANIIHNGSDEVLALFPDTKGQLAKVNGTEPSSKTSNVFGEYESRNESIPRNDSGSAARFFYCAKASKSERNLGCENLPLKTAGECTDRQEDTLGLNSPRSGAGRTSGSNNFHPTVKPLALLQYLCRLITPPNGLILDPFAGSGSTGIAATREGFNAALIEIDKEYCNICRARNKPQPL